MLITHPEALKAYGTPYRLWQGVPGIEVTGKHRIFLTFYSGYTREEIGNFVVVIKSDDGVHFSEPLLVADMADHRCFDPCLWMDPLGRLWLTWARYPDDGLYGAICEHPDAEEPVFGEPFFIGHEVMMNKPTVLKNGEWMFPVSVWHDNVTHLFPGYGHTVKEKGAYVYVTTDQGRTFERRGHSAIRNRCCDEHQVLEMQDGRLRMFVRTHFGIGAADSFDGGWTWTEGHDTGYGGPNARFHITRLRSGRVLLINHYMFKGRSHLTAMLSEDDGRTFPYKLLLDPRSEVSYPDAKQTADGAIYIVYDRERGVFKHTMQDVLASAREILTARITEADIMAGHLTNPGSYLQRIASKLGEYKGEIPERFRKT
jgi:hypothetical protein